MQNKFINKINVSTLIISLLFLLLIIFIANSIYLLSFITVLLLVLIILTNQSVKFYVESIKNTFLILLFVFIAYIIVTRNIIGSFIFLYKLILTTLYVKQFLLITKFQELVDGINTILKPISKKLNINMISYNIVIFIYFIDIYINSKKEIFNNYNSKDKIIYTFSIKRNMFPRFFLTISKIKNIENSLKIKNYKINYESVNKESIICVCSFISLFIIVFFKEVIL